MQVKMNMPRKRRAVKTTTWLALALAVAAAKMVEEGQTP